MKIQIEVSHNFISVSIIYEQNVKSRIKLVGKNLTPTISYFVRRKKHGRKSAYNDPGRQGREECA